MAGTLASLLIKLGLDASGVEQGVAKANASIGGLSAGASTAMRVAGSLIGSGLAVAAKGALEMEDRAAQFQADTGASADEAKHFAETVNAAAGSSLVSMDDIAASATRIRTDLGLTGDTADESLQSFVRYERATNQGADAVLAYDDILDSWNLTASDSAQIMDTLIAGQQTYGGSITESQDLLAKLAPVLESANMSWQQGAELINLFNAAGVDASAGITGLTKALGTVKSPEELQALLEDIANTTDPFERAQKAIDAFGAKAGPKLAQALQASGGDLSRFGFALDDVTGRTEQAADALDSTLTAKVRLGVNNALSLIRGFGMEVGPVLTGAFSAISLVKSTGLDRPLAPLFRGAAVRAGAVFSGALAKAVSAGRFVSALGSRLGDAASRLGSSAGGKFGLAFKAASLVGIVGLVVAAKEELDQLNTINAQNATTATQQIPKEMSDFLAGMPSRSDVEAKIAALKGLPDQLEGVDKAIYQFSDIADGNVLGSAVDLLFGGVNVSRVNEQQVAALQAYLDKLPAETATDAAAAGQQIGADVAAAVPDGVKAVAPSIDVPGVRIGGVKLGARWAQGVSDGIRQNLDGIQSSADAVNSALEKGPKLQSYEERLKQFRRATETTLRRLHAAVRANDPVAAAYYAQQYESIESSQASFRDQSKTVWGDVASTIDANAGAAKGDVGRLARTVEHQAAAAQVAMEHSAKRAGAAFPSEISAAVEPTRAAGQQVGGAVTSTVGTLPGKAAAWGDHAGSQFAGGLQDSVPATAEAAAELARAVHRFIAFSHPPRVGPLRTIRSWGPHLVREWTRPIGRHLREVERTAGQLAAAMTPMMPTWSAAGATAAGGHWNAITAAGPSGRGDVVHVHVGTLIANDAGLDELDRRLNARARLRTRGSLRTIGQR